MKARHYQFDVSGGSVVVIHVGCPWRAIVRDKATAIQVAVAHERGAHPGEEAAQNILYASRSRSRHAERS